MPRLKVKRSRLTLPADLSKVLHLGDEDYLEAEVVEGGVLLKPVSETARDAPTDAAIREGLEDVQAGRLDGPFESIEEMKEHFKKHPLNED